METTEIIKQIDAYLTLLHKARAILSGGGKRNHVAKVTRPERGTPGNSDNLAISRDRPTIKINSLPRTSPAGRVSSQKRTVASVQPQVLLPKKPLPEPSASMKPDNTLSTSIAVQRLPAQRQSNSTRLAAHRRVRPGNQESIKPGTALSNAPGSRIIVISAEQAQNERKRLAKPVAVPHRSPGSGSTGRLAFEALFSR
jgi:hypothetical protein